jgi:two-component system, OmpR family, sensor histidine kinase VicK
MLDLVTELRHLNGLKGGLAINETEYMATTLIQDLQPLTEVYRSNAVNVIEQGQYIFDTFWRNAIPADKKIKEIEVGAIPEVIESINDPIDLQTKVVELLNVARKEILVIFSTSNAFHRQEQIGSMKILKKIGEIRPEIKIKVLTPEDMEIEKTCKELAINPNFYFRFMDPISQVSILVIDRRFSIVAELRDDTKKTIAESIGLATYSNSAPTVLTYAVIFDLIWRQIELYEQLKVHDRMQKEFINAVAHDLRTPITPIIGLTKLVKDKLEDEKQKRLLDVVIDSGKKLHSLSENILAITKMEGNLFNISKETFDLSLVILDIIKDCVNKIKKMSKFNSQFEKKIGFQLYGLDRKNMVNADKQQISQVIFNIIDNAINFILNEGLISILVEQKVEDEYRNMVIVHIKDNGEGIHPEMNSRLFTKFSSKSSHGSGLGLYISKEIIQRHNGTIWGKNNQDGKGATFSFKLPVI